MSKQIEEPADLGIKIGTEDEVFWTKAKNNTEAEIKSCERTIEMDKYLLILINKKISEEKDKLK